MNTKLLPVVVQRCDAYERIALAELIGISIRYVGMSGSFYGKTVLLKPNLISGTGPGLACTHGEFIAGVAAWFLDHGAKVLLGDSPAFGCTTNVCHKQGISAALQGLDVTLVDFVSPVRIQLAGGTTVTVAREALECDFFVGLPKIKAHNQMYVTMAVKNIFGIVKGINKAMLHMVHGSSHIRFSGIILDLISLLPPQLHLADAIEVMHKSGPLDGSPFMLNCMAAARNPLALDTAMLELLKLDHSKSLLWRLAAQRGMEGGDLNKLCFPLLSPQDFPSSGFIAPDSLNSIRFNPFRFLRGMMKRMILKFSS